MNHQCERVRKGSEAYFACPFPNCGRLFRTKFSMKRHELIHSQEKQYTCKYCEKKFALPQYLKEHTYIHTQDKPYVCGVAGCQKKFRQAGKLSLHRRTHKEYLLKQYDCRVEFVDEAPIGEELEQPIKIPIPEPEVKPTEGLNPETKAEATGRQFLRQDSGQTTATANPKEDIREDFKDDQEIIFENLGPSEGGLTREALERFNQNVDAGDILVQYLSHIDTPLAVGLRPVLPLPFKCSVKPPASDTRPSPDLFDLIQRYSKD